MHCGFAFLQTPIRLGGEERIPIRIGDVFAAVVLADDCERLLGLAEVNFDLNAIGGAGGESTENNQKNARANVAQVTHEIQHLKVTVIIIGRLSSDHLR